MVLIEKIDDSIFDEKFDVLIVNRGDKYLDLNKNVKKEFFGFITQQNSLLQNIDICQN